MSVAGETLSKACEKYLRCQIVPFLRVINQSFPEYVDVLFTSAVVWWAKSECVARCFAYGNCSIFGTFVLKVGQECSEIEAIKQSIDVPITVSPPCIFAIVLLDAAIHQVIAVHSLSRDLASWLPQPNQRRCDHQSTHINLPLPMGAVCAGFPNFSTISKAAALCRSQTSGGHHGI